MGSFSIWHWLIVMAIIMLVFGTKKLGNIGADLGQAVKGFREGVKDSDDKPETQALAPDKENASPDGAAKDAVKS